MELMVVLTVIGVALALTVPTGIRWITDYQYSAGSRAFVNAAQLVRIKAIGGPITINASSIGPGGSDSEFDITLGAFNFVLQKLSGTPTCPTDIPVQQGDYVTLAGFNNPDFINGMLFLVTNVDCGAATISDRTATDRSDDWDVTTGIVLTAQCCSENDPTDCVKWPTGLGLQTTATGMVRIASSLRFVPFEENDPDRVKYTIERTPTGNSMECKYDPHWMNVNVYGPDPTDSSKSVALYDVSGAHPAPIVFDYAGTTRNHMTYTVMLRKVVREESGGVFSYVTVEDQKSPPIVFSIMPSGRIRLGQPGTYAD